MAGRPNIRAMIVESVLQDLRKDPGITNSWLAKKYGVKDRTIVRLIVQLRSIGAISTNHSRSRFLDTWVNRRKTTVLMTTQQLAEVTVSKKKGVEERKDQILRFAMDKSTVSNSAIAQVVGCHPSTVRRTLKSLKTEGRITSKVTRKPKTGTVRVLTVKSDPTRQHRLPVVRKKVFDLIVGTYEQDGVDRDMGVKVTQTWWNLIPCTDHWLRPGEDEADWQNRILSTGRLPRSEAVVAYQRNMLKKMGLK